MFKPKNIHVATDQQVNDLQSEPLVKAQRAKKIKFEIYKVLKRRFPEESMDRLISITEEIFNIKEN